MITRLNSLEDFKELKVGDNVILVTTKGKELIGTIEKELENRGYIDVNEIIVNIDDEYDLTVNVDKYLMGLGKLKDFLLDDGKKTVENKKSILEKAIEKLQDSKYTAHICEEENLYAIHFADGEPLASDLKEEDMIYLCYRLVIQANTSFKGKLSNIMNDQVPKLREELNSLVELTNPLSDNESIIANILERERIKGQLDTYKYLYEEFVKEKNMK